MVQILAQVLVWINTEWPHGHQTDAGEDVSIMADLKNSNSKCVNTLNLSIITKNLEFDD